MPHGNATRKRRKEIEASMEAVEIKTTVKESCEEATEVGSTKDSEEKTAGGIIIPDTAKEKPQEGEVVAVGPGSKNEDGKVSPMDVKIGDIVLFGKWSGTEVKIDGKEYSIMKEADIMGISKSKK